MQVWSRDILTIRIPTWPAGQVKSCQYYDTSGTILNLDFLEINATPAQVKEKLFASVPGRELNGKLLTTCRKRNSFVIFWPFFHSQQRVSLGLGQVNLCQSSLLHGLMFLNRTDEGG